MRSGVEFCNLRKPGQLKGRAGRGKLEAYLITYVINGENSEIGVRVNVNKSESERKPKSYNEIRHVLQQCSDGIFC
jgi:hypothetical protein